MTFSPSTSARCSRRSFFGAFRIVAWQTLYYLRGLDDISPEYDQCPEICGKGNKVTYGFCSECPQREAKEVFRETTIDFLNQHCGDRWERYGFDNLYSQVRDAFSLDAKTDTLTLTAASCARIIADEKQRQQRIDDWNRREQEKAAANK